MADKQLPAPYPYWNSTSDCPYSMRCREIDVAVENAKNADDFIQNALAEEQLSDEHKLAFFHKPKKSQIAEDICPAYVGHWNGGSVSSIVCSFAPSQLHDYCELKLCEKGRRAYCPIWKERGTKE